MQSTGQLVRSPASAPCSHPFCPADLSNAAVGRKKGPSWIAFSVAGGDGCSHVTCFPSGASLGWVLHCLGRGVTVVKHAFFRD